MEHRTGNDWNQVKTIRLGNEKMQLYKRARMPAIHCAKLDGPKWSHLHHTFSIEHSNRELMTVTLYPGGEGIGGEVCYDLKSDCNEAVRKWQLVYHVDPDT